MSSKELVDGDSAVVFGLGVTGKSMARALVTRNIKVTVIEDNPTDLSTEVAASIGFTLVTSPTVEELRDLLVTTDAFLPSPGIPESNVAFSIVSELGVRTLSEFDLARWWDDRPIAAITGTDGKTSVTMLTVAMLEASGLHAAAVGNTETPLVDAIGDPSFDAFVVEASSFRLAHSERFSPQAAAWLNFSPDHLDVHTSLASYEAAKAKIWESLPPDGLAVAPRDDSVVCAHLPTGCDTVMISGGDTAPSGGYLHDDWLYLGDSKLVAKSELPRAFDHDVTNALFAAALAMRLGATPEGVRDALRTYEVPPHRIQLVATIDGISFYNDSKATVPHAVVTAAKAFDSAVLIAGGRNKGLDLAPLREVAPRLRAVIAMGDAAAEIADVFSGHVPVLVASDMNEAVRVARSEAKVGDAVLLSPGCTSFDAYVNYGARGDDFIRAVEQLVEAS